MSSGVRGPALIGASLLAAGVGFGWWSSESKLSQVWDMPVAPTEFTAEPDRLEHGEHLVRHVLACGACHGADLAGGLVVDDAWHGEVWAPNLPDGNRDVADWVRAIRHGVGMDGQGLLFMPVSRYATLRERDLVDAVSWLARLPEVQRHTPEVAPAPWMRMRLVSDGYGSSVQKSTLEPVDLQPAPDSEWGAYLAQIAGCVDCHRDGNKSGRSPVSLRGEKFGDAWSHSWTGATFAAALTRGEGSGGPLQDKMPWRFYEGLNDLERDALWMWMRSSDAVVAASDAVESDH